MRPAVVSEGPPGRTLNVLDGRPAQKDAAGGEPAPKADKTMRSPCAKPPRSFHSESAIGIVPLFRHFLIVPPRLLMSRNASAPKILRMLASRRGIAPRRARS